jgi:hypothetical protein
MTNGSNSGEMQNGTSHQLKHGLNRSNNKAFVVENTPSRGAGFDQSSADDFFENALFQSPNSSLDLNGRPSDAPQSDWFRGGIYGSSGSQVSAEAKYTLDKRVHGGFQALTALRRLQADDGMLPSEKKDEVSSDGVKAMLEGEGEGSHCSYLQGGNLGSPTSFNVMDRSKQASEEVRSVTVKAKYCDDTVRFKLGGASTYQEMMEEVGKRFRLKADNFTLKYLDDDEEWVMLTCDADVLECFSVIRDSGANHVKLIVRDAIGGHGARSSSESIN